MLDEQRALGRVPTKKKPRQALRGFSRFRPGTCDGGTTHRYFVTRFPMELVNGQEEARPGLRSATPASELGRSHAGPYQERDVPSR
jgi:hypothetical protein